jgi:hypothetical protein
MAKLTLLKVFAVKPPGGGDKLASTPVQARVVKRGGLIVNQTAKTALNQT